MMSTDVNRMLLCMQADILGYQAMWMMDELDEDANPRKPGSLSVDHMRIIFLYPEEAIAASQESPQPLDLAEIFTMRAKLTAMLSFLFTMPAL